jgi:hypothetical protein
MSKIYATIAFALLLPLFARGQFSFSNANDRLAVPNVRSGVAIAVADMNGDGLDDIVRLSQGRILMIEYQQAGGGQFLNYTFGQIANQSQWSICVGDLDNDGFNEILTGGRYDGVKLIRTQDGGASYAVSNLPGPNMFVQGTNLVDINNDGFLDYFACHDDAESRIWANDSLGNLVPADDWIDMATVPPSDNSGNYGSVWADFDNDGDLDLYIAKCRQGVNSPADPRRINALFVNDGNGNFTEQAADFNLKIGAQSWTAEFMDIDNDGDLDCFITNHDQACMLLENDGTGVFTDITAASGIAVQGLAIQAIMRDFDNDGFVDLLVAGTRHHLFRNNGDKTFTEVTGLFDQNWIESYAIGDLNHDGWLDIYAGYAQIYTNPSNIDDVLWLNTGQNGNNFLTVNLIGEQSNRNGVGARLELYGPWGIQVREVRAGESYGIMNSFAQHFGLGQSTQADSLIVRWPSGIVDRYEEVAANQFITLLEDACTSPEAFIIQEGPSAICSGDTVYLHAPEGFSYQWSTGDTTQSIAVTEQGSYNVTITDGSPCFGVSPNVSIVVNPQEMPTIMAEGELRFCAGGSVVLTASEAASYLWSTGEAGASIVVAASGAYTVAVEGLCETFTSPPVSVEVLPAPAPEIDSVGYAEETAMLAVNGSNVFWYAEPVGGEPLSAGNLLVVPIASDTVFYAENVALYPGTAHAVGMAAHQGNAYSGNQFNSGIVFDCYSPFTLHTVKVYTDTEGARVIELQDAGGDVLQRKEVHIPSGEHLIELGFDILPGTDLFLTTNTAHNDTTFGYASPRLQRSSAGVQYPYVVEGVASLKTSTLGADRYYYFYDWRIQEPSLECVSERIAVGVQVVSSREAAAGAGLLRIAPNPTEGHALLLLPAHRPGAGLLRVLNATGRLAAQASVPGEAEDFRLDLSAWPAGLYYLHLAVGTEIWVGKVVKR